MSASTGTQMTRSPGEIPASCIHNASRACRPLKGCPQCGGSGRVPYESDDYPPGTNACCCTCPVCRGLPASQDPSAQGGHTPHPGYFVQVRAELPVLEGIRVTYTWIPWEVPLPAHLVRSGQCWRVVEMYPRFLVHRRYWTLGEKDPDAHLPMICSGAPHA